MTTKTTTTYPTAETIRGTIHDEILGEIGKLGAASTTAHGMRMDLERQVSTLPDFSDEIELCVREGRVPTVEALEEYAQAQATRRYLEDQIEALASFQRQALDAPPVIRRNRAGDVLTYLGEALRDLAEYARGLDPHWRIPSPEVALMGGDAALQKYREAQGVVEAYDTIRSEQSRAYGDAGARDLTDAFYRSGIFRDALDAETYWLDRRREAGRTPTQRRVGNPFFSDVPVSPYRDVRGGHWPYMIGDLGEKYGFIIWGATNHDLWVPSVEELRDADHENARRVTPSNWNRQGYRGPRVMVGG